MSFNDPLFLFEKYNVAVDLPWTETVSNNGYPFVPPKGNMIFLSGDNMIYLSGDRMSYLET